MVVTSPPNTPPVAQTWASRSLALRIIALLYLACMWLEAAGFHAQTRKLPGPLLYFVQTATLFPNAAKASIDYRAEGWLCDAQKWVELDTRPYFPMHANDKENRFQRVLHFYRENRPTMQSLESYVLAHASVPATLTGGPDTLGGVRFLSLRLPIPQPGQSVAHVVREPLDAFPESLRHNWYWTPQSRRQRNCDSVQ